MANPRRNERRLSRRWKLNNRLRTAEQCEAFANQGRRYHEFLMQRRRIAVSAPKQIIYPMRYLRPLLSGGSQDEQRFEVALRSFLGCNVHVIPLGRARAGLYLLAKHARHDGRDRVIMLPYTIPDVVNMIRF